MTGLKIAYVTTYDSNQIDGAWSGTGYWIARALEEAGANVTRISVAMPSKPRFAAFKRRLARIEKAKFVESVEPSVVKKMAHDVDLRLNTGRFDVVLSPGYFPVAYLKSSLPLVIWGDATFELIDGYHPSYQGVSRLSRKAWCALERQAQSHAHLLVYSSRWAANSAISYYGTSPAKVAVTPFGANLEHPPNYDPPQRELPRSGKIRLLLVGTSWHWKGVDIACEAIEELDAAGIDVRLDVVGCKAPNPQSLSRNVTVHGFISKGIPSHHKYLEELFNQAHVFIHPTRSECYGIVMCEANSYGLPVIAHNTGGVSEIIHNGENGVLYDTNDGPTLAKAIEALIRDPDRYADMSKKAGEHFLSRLNWKTAGAQALQLIEDNVSEYNQS